MEVLKYVLIGLYAIICLPLIVLVMSQAKQSAGASETIVGGNNTDHGGSFYDKNKGRTKDGIMKRWTIILGILFAIATLGLGIFLELTK